MGKKISEVHLSKFWTVMTKEPPSAAPAAVEVLMAVAKLILPHSLCTERLNMGGGAGTLDANRWLDQSVTAPGG
jgi:hypothetical protein